MCMMEETGQNALGEGKQVEAHTQTWTCSGLDECAQVLLHAVDQACAYVCAVVKLK